MQEENKQHQQYEQRQVQYQVPALYPQQEQHRQ